MNKIKKILMERDGMSSKTAQESIDIAINQLKLYLDDGDIGAAEYICEEFFGLEPDYIEEIINEM